MFNITIGDEGRPITDFTHRLSYDDLEQDARTVLRDLTPQEREYLTQRVHGLLSKDLTPPEYLLNKVNSLLESVDGHSMQNK